MSEVVKVNHPTKPTKNKQYDLFTSFFGDPNELSNTLELWDSIPKYALSRRQQMAMRDDNGRLGIHEHYFEYKPYYMNEAIKAKVKILPALIEMEDGTIKDFYPSQTEEIIEEILKKIFTDQRFGLHFPREGESWVRFTLHMIRKELKERGKTRSLQEIKQSLEIMARCSIEVHFAGRGRGGVYNNPILSNLVRQTREDLADDPGAKWMVQLPALISKSVDELTYRQFNYALHMRLKTSLSRWMHKRLLHRFRNAGLGMAYHFSYNTIAQDSGLMSHSRKTRNIEAVAEALKELQSEDVIASWKQDVKQSGRSIDDVVFTVFPSAEFAREMKASHARFNDSQKSLQQR